MIQYNEQEGESSSLPFLPSVEQKNTPDRGKEREGRRPKIGSEGKKEGKGDLRLLGVIWLMVLPHGEEGGGEESWGYLVSWGVARWQGFNTAIAIKTAKNRIQAFWTTFIG